MTHPRSAASETLIDDSASHIPAHLGPDSPAVKAQRLTTPGDAPQSQEEPPELSARFQAPLHGAGNPSSTRSGTTPGSFARAADIGGPLAFTSPDTPGMPAPSDKTAWDFLPDGWRVEQLHREQNVSVAAPHRDDVHVFTDARGVTRRVTTTPGFTPITQLESARLGIITPQMQRVAQREPHLSPEQVRDEVASGRLIIPANPAHLRRQLDPMCIGRASRTKVNANMGASPVSSGADEELEKLRWAERWGADTVMDLSTGGDLDACRQAILDHSTVPIGTVPIYSMIIGRRIEELTPALVMETLERQAQQGVDYFTIHAGVRRAHLPFVRRRLIGIVSRGGSLLAKWMLHHNRDNLMYDMWDEICELLRAHDVSFSIGDGLRPGGLGDATDEAQLRELETIGELTERAWRQGVQVMVEGPGHVPLDQIEYNMKLERRLCHGAPFYVLGPLVTDVFPGYDHITSCIGATNAAYHGASMLCYVTPKEHLGLPGKNDVKEGCIAYRIAAHAADVALGMPGARNWDDDLTRARAALNWSKHFELAYDTDTARALHDEDLDVDTDFCAMCGHDWCSVRISKEIQEFMSGNEEGFERVGAGGKLGAPIKSGALTSEQQEILTRRGALTPAQIKSLANKTKQAMTGEAADARPACHSKDAESDQAKRLQQDQLGDQLVQLNTAPANNIPVHDPLI